ncbi:MAG: glutathione S-transferase family protein [Candidatus Tectomicrobia bacterium]
MIRVLGRKTSGNVQKVLWMMEELGIEYDREDYGRQFGNTADDAYLAMNPTGKVPTIVDGETVLWESHSILRYLCAKSGSELLPADPADRARAEIWMDWLLASLNANYVEMFKESKKAENERSPDLAKMGDALAAHLKVLDDHLADREWLGGNVMTMAEIALGPIVNRCLGFPIELPVLSNLRRWHDTISQRSAYQKVVAA